MNDIITKLIYLIIPIICILKLLSIYNGIQNYEHQNKLPIQLCSKPTTFYYFWNGAEYIKADSQNFRIIFTGEVVNAYFTVGNKEFNTLNYYKEVQPEICPEVKK